MRTEDLVSALAADTVPRPTPGARMGKALPLALVASVGMVLLFWGLRADLHAVLVSPVMAKTLVPLALAAVAFWLARELVRPDAPARIGAVVCALIGAAVMAGLAVALVIGGGGAALAQALDTGSLWVCLLSVPVLAAAPLVAALWALRSGAPLRPAAAGAAAGLLAGAAGAAVYSFYCTEDAALFVIPAYGVAIGSVCLCGALLGRRVLRW